MIKNIFIFVFYLISIGTHVQSQDYIKILGRNHYNRCSDYYKMTIDFSNFSAKNQFTSCYELLLHNIQTAKIEKTEKAQLFVYLRNINDVYLTDSIINELGLKATLHYSFDKNNFEYQDELAIDAIKDANLKANLLAKMLGKKIDKIINIDDVVEKYLFYDDYIARTECERKVLSLLMDYFAKPEDPSKTEFEFPCINGQYAVWVTYKLKQ